MILYYVRPYFAIPKEDAGYFLLPPEEIIDMADCLTWSGGYAVPGSYREYVFGPGVKIVDDHAPFNVRTRCYYKYLNTIMCEVSNRVECFSEINTFMSVNKIDTEYTIIEKEDYGLYIKLGEYKSGREVVKVVSFILADKELQKNEHQKFEEDHYILPSRPDKYLQTYFDFKNDKNGGEK